MWEKYHGICSSYRSKPLPSLFEYEKVPFHAEIDEIKAVKERNRETAKKNAEIEEIIYILENEHKIANIIQNLEETFDFSREDIEESISFYDVLFILPWNEIFDKVTFFIKLLGSKENFFSAMRIGTPEMRVDEFDDFLGKGFFGIMHYKKMHLFKDKLDSLADTLSLPKKVATKIFVSNFRYFYNSAQTTEKIINQWSSILNVTNKQLGQALKKHPCYLSYGKNSQLKELIQHFMCCFSISREDAVKIILCRPDIVYAPLYEIKEALKEEKERLPIVVSQKYWLYPVYYIANFINGGYDYGNYETVLKFLEYVEDKIGSIIDMEYGNMNPCIGEGTRWTKEIAYCVLVVKKMNSENEYCFVSLGSGYQTYQNSCKPQTPEDRMMKAIFGEKFKKPLTEFIVDIPSLYGEEYDRIFDRLIIMSSTGNITPCECTLKDGTSIVVEDLVENEYENFEHNSISCMFKTLNVIQTSQVEEYKQKYAFSFHPTDSLLFDEDLDDIFGDDLDNFDSGNTFDDFDDLDNFDLDNTFDDFDDQKNK